MKKKIINAKYELKYDYYADDNGHIWSGRSQKYISEHEDKDGYLKVKLMCKDNTNGHRFSVHRLILQTFQPIENVDDYQVDHIDGNKKNNTLENLRWVTCAENLANPNTKFHRRCYYQNGELNPSSKLNNEKVLKIIKLLQSKKYTCAEIGQMFNVCEETVRKIKHKQAWAHLTKNIIF